VSPNLVNLVYVVLIGVAFWFFLIRPQMKRQKDQTDLQSAIKPGDRIITVGGLYGTIERIEDEVVELRVADGVVLEYSRSAILRKVDAFGEPVAPAADEVEPDAEPAHKEHGAPDPDAPRVEVDEADTDADAAGRS
jgi:preprotein translocase subunit YajC